MREEIMINLDSPRQLEKLYRDNKLEFRSTFNQIYPDIQDKATARVWNERLNFENEEISWGSGNELFFVIAASLLAGLFAKIPDFAAISHDYFYPRNISFIVLPLLTAYFAWKQRLPLKGILLVSAVYLIAVFYINLLPDNPNSHTLLLACIHLPLLLWSTMGFAFSGDNPRNYQVRLEYLRYNGDLIVITAVMLIAGGLLTAITFGLFELIDVNIEKIFGEYIVIWGLSAAPIVGTYLVRTNPQLVNKVSPVIARVFTPLVLAILILYLIAVVYTGKDPYNDREFLIIFNLLLIGVMAIIFFSIAETSKKGNNQAGKILLFGLSIVTVIINSIALSAIIFRIAEWGITPNRIAVLGGNVLILTNLLIVTYHLFRSLRYNSATEGVEKSIAAFLPVYTLWTIVVTFIFPVLFNFR